MFTNDSYIFDKIETLPRSELLSLQNHRLQEAVLRASHLPFYKEVFSKHKVDPSSIKSISDISRLPFTTKQDLRNHYPLGFLGVPRSDIVRIHGSSGTTGRPTFVPYSRHDLDVWSNVVARFLVAAGLRPEHLVQICFGYGLFTGGFGLHYGVEKVGAGVIPAASGNTERQLLLLQDLQPDALVCTPSYALNLGEALESAGINISNLSLKLGFFGGEPWTEDMRARIESKLGLFATDNYGLSEIVGPGLAGECRFRCGMHISEDHFLVECLNPDTLEPVAEGESGELVITTLTKEAMPVLRYRTRDISSLDRSVCSCGRTGTRMSRVTGRTDDMLIIRGVNVYPTQVEEALLRVKGTAPHYMIELTRPQSSDRVTVKVEVAPELFSASIREMEELRSRIMKEIQSLTCLRMEVELVAPQTLERFLGKARRVVDHRNLGT